MQRIVESLNSQRGTAYDTTQPSNVYAENMGVARALAGIWSGNNRLANQFDPDRMTDFLPRWEAVLGLHPLVTDTDVARRAKVKAAFQRIGQAPTYQVLLDACRAQLGAIFVGITHTSSAQAVIWTPSGFTYGLQDSTGVIDWYSTVSHVAIQVTQPAGMSDALFYQTAASIYPVCDALLPAWVTFDWYRYTGFMLDKVANLDNSVFVAPPPPMFSLDFTTYTPGAITIPSGLTFTRAASGTGDRQTVQTSTAGMVDVGAAADIFRIGQFGLDSTTRGAVIEQNTLNWLSPATGELVLANQGAGTTATFTNPFGGPDPLGLSPGNGNRAQITSGGSSGPRTSGFAQSFFSLWARATTGTVRQTSVAGAVVYDQTIDTTWRRILVGDSLGGACVALDAGLNTGLTGARDGISAYYQIETSSTPSEFIYQTSATQGSRNIDALTINAISALIDTDGRASLVFDWIPKGNASGNASYLSYAATLPLLTSSNTSAPTIAITNPGMLLTVSVGGVTWTSSVAMSWSMQDNVQLFVAVGNGVDATTAIYRVKPNGSSVWGATITLGTGSVAAACATTGSAGLWYRSGSQTTFSSWVRKLDAYHSGDRPPWA